MTSTKMYQQNQNLGIRLLESLILYLNDTLDDNMNLDQRAQSKDAAFTLLDSAVSFINEDLPHEIQVVLIRIFSKCVHDLSKNDLINIQKDIKALYQIRSLLG